MINKAEILGRLSELGITSADAEFNGSGDEGWVEHVSIEPAKNDTRENQEVVEEIVYSILEDSYPGWELDDGSFGHVILTPDANLIRIEYNQNYMESEYSESEL